MPVPNLGSAGAWASGRQPRLTGRHAVFAGVIALVMTAVAPPVFGWGVNRFRVERTEARAEALAVVMRGRLDLLNARAGEVAVACGPGRLPNAGPTGQWVSRAIQAPRVFPGDAPTDAWGRCFLVNLAGLRAGAPVWVMSAGSDGIITTYPDAAVLDRDDIGVRVQ